MLLLAVLMAACTAPDTWELVSKDNNIRFVLANKKDKGEVNLCYSVYYRDTPVSYTHLTLPTIA